VSSEDSMKETKAIIRIEFSSEKRAAIVLNALKPETEASPVQRSKVEVKREGNVLILSFKTTDTTVLRASINAYTRWIKVIDDILSGAEAFTPFRSE